MVTFGGSGSLLACRLMDILELAGRARAAQPGQRLGLRPADRRRAQRLRAHRGGPRRRLDLGALAEAVRRADRARPERRCAGEGFDAGTADRRAVGRPAVRRPGLRGRVDCPDGRDQPRLGRRAWSARSTMPTGPCTATTSAATRDQQVEWVNLRVTGIGPIRPAVDQPRSPPATGVRPPPGGTGGALRRLDRRRRSTTGAHLRRRRHRRRPGGDPGVRLDRAGAPGLPRHGRPFGNLLLDARTARR